MSLKVYRGDQASRDYEYDFFRDFSSNLVKVFEEENLDGILIGHPVVPANNYLQPDCVLITQKRLVLIDFKNYKGKMWLPDESAFEETPWRCDGVNIGGGSSINPFAQLKKQKTWLEEIIDPKTYGQFGIACVVCFQGDMTIMNKVPGKYQSWFSVTNLYQYPNRIYDIVTVKNNNDVDIEQIAEYFEAKPYHDYYPVSFEDVKAASEANERSAEADRREYEANQKVKELKKKIEEAEKQKRAATSLTEELEKAKKEAYIAKKSAEAIKDEFNEKKHTLELETQKAIKARANAQKAQAEERKAMIDASASEKKAKARLAGIIIISLVSLLVLATGIWIVIDKNNRESQRIAEEEAQLVEDYKNGRKCIPVEQVSEYVNSKGVCVDFYASYINESPKYVFIDNAKNGTFALMISKQLLSRQDATSTYLNKHLEARGTITKYKDDFEIIIEDLSQITVK